MSDMEEARPDEPKRPVSELFGRTRVFLVLAVLGLELVIFFAGLLFPLPPSTRTSIANAANAQFSPFQGAGPVRLAGLIFSHNLLIAMIEAIPAVGPLLLVVSTYSTGLAAQALVASQGLPPQFGAILFAFPYSLVELSAYAVAVTAGTELLAAWPMKRLGSEARVFALELVGVVVILLAAAAMEATTKTSPLLGFALWLPAGGAVAAALIMARRRRL